MYLRLEKNPPASRALVQEMLRDNGKRCWRLSKLIEAEEILGFIDF
jgi:hypothetical protein